MSNPFPSVKGTDYETLRTERFNAGMITNVDSFDLPEGALTVAKNVRIRFDKTQRRVGHSLFTPAKPNSLKVMNYVSLRTNAGASYEYRFTKSTIHRRNPPNWTVVAGTLTGTDNDKFIVILANNRFFFANNGADVIQEINFAADTFAALGNAPKYRFITGFFNRIVGGNRASGGALGVELGWSGLNNLGEFDNAVDNTAGNAPLVESPSDLSDHIKGLFSLNNTLIILRERSVWHANKQPVPTNPFNAYSVIPGIGCDCPYSAVVTEFGLAWIDTRTKAVWAYQLGQAPSPISKVNEDEIFKNIDNPDLVECAYDSRNRELHCLLPITGTIVIRDWIYNFNTKSWAYDEISDISTIRCIDLGSGYTSINSLIGTTNQLVGNINSLSPSSIIRPTVLIGKTSGELLIEDTSVKDDTTEFVSEWTSKKYNFKDIDFIVKEIRLFLRTDREVHVQLYVSVNNKDFVLVREMDLISNDSFKLKHKKLYRCTSFQYKLLVTSGGLVYPQKDEIDIYPTGESKDDNR